MKKISELSIANLKAAYDFVKTPLDSLKEIEKNIKTLLGIKKNIVFLHHFKTTK